MEKPIRFVCRIVHPADSATNEVRRSWQIAVRRKDAERVSSLAGSGRVITPNHVAEWFRGEAKGFQLPQDRQQVNAFVAALNVLRVSVSKTVREIHTLSPGRIEMDLLGIKGAITLLATKLPILISKAPLSDASPPELANLLKLQILAAAAEEARDAIFAVPPIRKETVWHDDARLIEWHLRRLLVSAGAAEPIGCAWNSPLTRLVVASLRATGHAAENGAVASVLADAARRTKEGMTEEKFALTSIYMLIA